MPHLFSFASSESDKAMHEMEHELLQLHTPRRPSLLKNIGSLLWRHHQEPEVSEPCPQTAPPIEPEQLLHDYFHLRRHSFTEKTTTARKPVPSLPRPQTFRRQQSERREKLLEVEPSLTERRALSADRRRGLSATAARRPTSPRLGNGLFASAPQVGQLDHHALNIPDVSNDAVADLQKQSRLFPGDLPSLQIPEQYDDVPELDEGNDELAIDRTSLHEEYERRWILNLSMHFRDKSKREKFFVTYAETPSRWRKVTVSLDYRFAPQGSLEADLSTLHYQRDKSFRIYEAIRESLPDIQYYDTVTNLKLATTPEDGQLHVYVREDANEIIEYPCLSLFEHVRVPTYAESELDFISHLSGFVYKVRVDGVTVIKKEIPGPDAIDESVYEVNALDSLLGCDSVVQLIGLVVDDDRSIVKGLLISDASQGALVDMIYDFRGELPWPRREKWAKQIVHGLSEIHEAGFVQGDFTLSNIVIDERDNAQIIDINRRGCPVGWEPPELGRLIDSGQRIGMCIGVKTDLFQLGMVLWALAEEVDEPERVERPLPPVVDSVPAYFRHMIETCLNDRPQGRASAKKLLRSFPASTGFPPCSTTKPPPPTESPNSEILENSTSTHRSAKEYIDPALAVTIDEVRRRRPGGHDFFLSDNRLVTYVVGHEKPEDSTTTTTTTRFDSCGGSWVVPHCRRGRSPVSSCWRRRRFSGFGGEGRRTGSSATSLSDDEQSPKSRRRPRGESWDCEREMGNEVKGEGERVVATGDGDGDFASAGLVHADSGFDEQVAGELEPEPTGGGTVVGGCF